MPTKENRSRNVLNGPKRKEAQAIDDNEGRFGEILQKIWIVKALNQ